MNGEKTPVDPFNGAWRRFERYLNGLYPPDRRGGSDSEAQIRSAMADGVVTREQGGFLEACRRVRNAFTHVTFDEYDGPAAAPPQPVVVRLERLVRELVDRVRVKEVTKPALTRRADDRLQDVLREMKGHDYTQVPYHLDGTGWLLLRGIRHSHQQGNAPRGRCGIHVRAQATDFQVAVSEQRG